MQRTLFLWGPSVYFTIRWDARNDMGEGISGGMYIYTIQTGEF